ncbi:MAG: hypothetical protein MPJ25_13510, partial [Pirellulales bacterium]|nr:hypothetical protein [Pirellulales bacterium]
YGNRTISSFLRMVSAEMPSTSDQIVWLEQGRLHTRYTGLAYVGNPGTLPTSNATASITTAPATTGGAQLVFQFTGAQQGPSTSLSDTTEGDDQINFRVGQTVMVQRQATGSGDTSKGVGPVSKGVVTGVSTHAFRVQTYTALGAGNAFGSGTAGAPAAGDRWTALIYGSEFAKGTGNFTEKLDPSYSTYQNSPIIMKEHYSINGSDTAQIGWIEVTSENGAGGYLWYVKAEHENRLRWEDYLEMGMVEGVLQSGTGASLGAFRGDFGDTGNSGQTAKGTEGLFAALESRGNIYNGLAGDLFPTSANQRGIVALADSFDVILKQLDKQGSIEENMLYVNRDLALAFDNFLATQNNYGGSEGVSWGVFNNAKDMAIDLGFSGFRRGSYDFYKTDWKYLNDHATRGGFGNIEGVLVPAGTSTVYDMNLGKNIKRPFLHVRYRSSETENRKMKSWITGSVGGAYTTDVDEMRMHYLTERCLITQGANNFFLLTNV